MGYGDYPSHFTNIAPREIVLGRRREWKQLKNGKRRIALIPERFNCFPSSILRGFAKQSEYFGCHPKVSELGSSLLCDFNDGTIVQPDKLFTTVPQSLKIILYYDDVEITTQRESISLQCFTFS